ncbi:uncharacterized protein F4817DRAFT_349054 [Daldinia loculata]|uniref:uncharacterized protein n=1 Tax=Daldinia loculata TaxID=103429 RepID=UPI0020C2F053|nr:uncharacterized protein F4817DRAFT_349054 [Daldinia loculata]KAI1643692.1 hypothetical protein F4817DRAFT_349054 [Daldinia loculata]
MVPNGERIGLPIHGCASEEKGSCRKAPSVVEEQDLDTSKSSTLPIQKLIFNIDWSKSALGPRDQWSSELRHMSRFLLADTSPAILFWGEPSCIIYNDAYLPILGNKHPESMGMDASQVFSTIWDQLSGKISAQRRTGQTCTCTSTRLLIDRDGHVEETYFDWKLIPVTNDEGEVKGSYGTPIDRTEDVICSRQNECIQQLCRHTATANNMKELWHTLLTGLSYNSKDIPFALLYSLDEQHNISSTPSQPNYPCHLEGIIGIDRERIMGPEYLDLSCDIDGFAPTMLKTLKCDSVLILEESDPSLHKLLNGIGWKGYTLAKEFAIVSIKDDFKIAAFMVVGLNPYRRYSSGFCEFLKLVADVAASQVSRARLSEEVSRHNDLAKRAQLDRKRSDMRFSRFAERSIVGLAVTDVNGKIIYANDVWYKFSGLSPADQNNLSWFDSVVPEDADLLREWQEKVLSNKTGGTFQIRSREPFRRGQMYSDHRTGICACYSDLDEFDEVESIMIFTMDISELKWTEQQLISRSKALEESEIKWRNYAEHCPLGICRTDGDGHVQYGNDAWRSFYGFGPDSPSPDIPQPWLPWVREDYLQPCKDFFARLQQHTGPESFEFQLIDRTYTISGGDNTVTNGAYVVATGFSQFKEDGTVDHIDFWVTDISGQKMAVKVLTDKMEEAIRSRTQQERFMDMISHEIRNPLSAVLHCSEEIIESVKRSSATLDAVFDGKLAISSNSPAKEILKEEVDSALDAANTIVYCVQHQKQIVDDVLTVSKLDSDLLVVSPIPVQPMALVRSSLKIFDAELKMTGIKLKVIEDDSLSMLGLGCVLLDPHRFLQIVINLVTNAIKFTKTSKRKEIVVRVAGTTYRPLESELGVDYVPQRYSPVSPVFDGCSLGGLEEPQEDVFLSFSVKDTGRGLTESEKAQVFNRFAQASPKTHIEYGGSGLGLFISRQITEMLGGEIGMASSPGSGCKFAFYVKTQRCEFPRYSSNASEPVVRLSRSLSIAADGTPLPLEDEDEQGGFPQISEDPSPPPHEHPPIKVLVVEDNLVNQKVLCKQLRNHDFVVKAANHGKDALDAVLDNKTEVSHAKSPFDVILCDIEMPIMNGIEFTREIRRLEAKGELTGHIPILGVTANVRSKQVSGAMEVGMDGVTTKPYHIEELIAHIGDVCAKY